MEFSSLGGWVATRASGMKKNIYGNIEDLVGVNLHLPLPHHHPHSSPQLRGLTVLPHTITQWSGK